MYRRYKKCKGKMTKLERYSAHIFIKIEKLNITTYMSKRVKLNYVSCRKSTNGTGLGPPFPQSPACRLGPRVAPGDLNRRQEGSPHP